jgi:hypothetical protein
MAGRLRDFERDIRAKIAAKKHDRAMLDAEIGALESLLTPEETPLPAAPKGAPDAKPETSPRK